MRTLRRWIVQRAVEPHGAGRPREATQLGRRTIEVGGLERTYWFAPGPTRRDGPAPPAARAPLLVVFHGLDVPVAAMAEWTRLATRGPAAGFATVFPEGVGEMWDDIGSGRSDGADDEAFVRALVEHLTVDDGVGAARSLFLVGLSNGACFAERLARTGVVEPRGIVLVAGTAREASRQEVPRPAAPTAVLLFAGTADPTMPYAGGRATGPLSWSARRRVQRRLLVRRDRSVAGAEELAREWASVNGLASPPASHSARQPASQPVTGTDLPTTRLSWTAPGHPPVVLYRVEGGAHGWPGGPQYLPARLIGRIPQDLDATGILLSFAREVLDATPAGP